MKKLLLILTFLAFANLKSNAQLTISQFDFIIYADTVVANTIDSAKVWVVNPTGTTFNDALYVILDVQDSASVTFHNVDTLAFGALNIPPNDSVNVKIVQNFIVGPQKYHYDINVIVIWPYAISTGAGDSLIFPVFITIPDGINELNLLNYIKIYPNPTSERINIDTQNSVEEVRIYTVSGQLKIVEKNKLTIDISELPAGIYLVNVKLKNGKTQQLKIMKK